MNIPVCTSACGILLIWEYMGQLKQSNKRPSIPLLWISNFIKKFFEKIGSSFAFVSSFLVKLNFKLLWKSIVDLLRPFWEIIKAPIHFYNGYMQKAASYGDKKNIIFLGSIIWIFFFAYLLYVFVRNNPEYFSNTITKIKNIKY